MLRAVLASVGPALVLISAASVAGDNGHRDRFAAKLRGIEEVPSLSSTASGRFKATIDDENQTITFELSYSDLEAAPTQAHIHVGQRAVNGGVSVFLCGPAPAASQTCPVAPATITGVLTPANIIGPVGQGLDPATDAANGFNELVQLLRKGVTYVNVHTTRFPGGEIRGQVHAHR